MAIREDMSCESSGRKTTVGCRWHQEKIASWEQRMGTQHAMQVAMATGRLYMLCWADYRMTALAMSGRLRSALRVWLGLLLAGSVSGGGAVDAEGPRNTFSQALLLLASCIT